MVRSVDQNGKDFDLFLFEKQGASIKSIGYATVILGHRAVVSAQAARKGHRFGG
jgi:hypothetical protein